MKHVDVVVCAMPSCWLSKQQAAPFGGVCLSQFDYPTCLSHAAPIPTGANHDCRFARSAGKV